MYLAISSTTEGKVLQTELACLEQWEKMWDMQLNPSKCQVFHITRKVKLLNTKYVLHNVELKSASLLQQNILGLPLSGHSWSMLQLYDIPTTTKIEIMLKQFKEGLQGGQPETINTLPASLLC